MLLCKVPTHMEIKDNKIRNKTLKEALEIPGTVTTKIYPTIRIGRNFQKKWETNISKLHIIKPSIKE